MNHESMPAKVRLTEELGVMGHCKTCEHWDTTDYRAIAWRRDGHDWGLCVLLTVDSRPADQLAEAACYTEGIGGDFLARAMFGCLLYEKA